MLSIEKLNDSKTHYRSLHMKILLRIIGGLSSLLIIIFLAQTVGCSEQGSVTSFEQENLAVTDRFTDVASKKINNRDLSPTLDLLDQPE